MAGTFDTLRAARRLRDAGASEPVAEAIAEVLRESREFDLSQIATKLDLEQLRLATKADLEQLRVEIANAKSATLKWVIGLMIAQTAAIVGLVKLVLGHG